MVFRSFMIPALILVFVGAQENKPEKVANLELPAPTNLKVLKVATGAEVVQVMRTFTAGLGVQCSFCHVDGNFASDDNPKKTAARGMLKMVMAINAEFNDGKMHVSCYTCHRGETQPKTAPAPESKTDSQ